MLEEKIYRIKDEKIETKQILELKHNSANDWFIVVGYNDCISLDEINHTAF